MKHKLSSIIAIALAFSMSTSVFAAQSKYFQDVNDESCGWAAQYIDYLCEKGIANGIGGNNYSPSLPIERGDFIVLIDKAFKLTPVLGYSVYFSDVSEDMYYYQPIVNAKGNNIIKDMGAFYPETPITRADAMTILYRAMSYSNAIKTTGSTDLSMYADGDFIKNPEVQNAIGTLTKLGIISGSDGYLKPMDTMTRAEMAVVFSKALQYAESVGSTTPTPSKNKDTDNKNEVSQDTQKDTEQSKEDNASTVKDKELDSPLVLDGNPYTNAENITAKQFNDASVNALVEVKNKIKSDIDTADLNVNSNTTSAISVAGNSELNLNSANIKTVGNRGNGINIDATSTVNADNCTINAYQPDSSAVKTQGKLDMVNSTIEKSKGNAFTLYDNSDSSIDSSTINANGADNVFFVTTTNNLEKKDKTSLTLSNSTVNADKGTLFMVDTCMLDAVIENCTIGNLKELLNSTYSSVAKNNYSNDIKITLKNQVVEADLHSDENSVVELVLTDGSYFKGRINETNFSDYISIHVDSGSTLELLDDAYISTISVEDMSFIDIKDNSHFIYYDDSLEENDWLNGESISLPQGGELRPYE